MTAAKAQQEILDRIGGSLWGLFIGDAMAMPTHWFYGGASQIVKTYGGQIKTFTQPKAELPGSIMNLSSTGGGGRGSDSGDIIGTVINHGKKKYWTRSGSYHYHCTLQKGENTLEAQLVRLLCRSITEKSGQFDANDFREKYVKFMTTPGSHNDCYASTCHRMYFANMKSGCAPEKCPDNDGHNVDAIDGIILTVPVVLANCGFPLDDVAKESKACASVTRNSKVLGDYAGHFASILVDTLGGKPLLQALETNAGRQFERSISGARSRPDPVVA